MPGEDPAHAVNEGEHDEESDDCRDRMANSARIICNEYADAVEQGPQDGGSAGTRRSIPRSMTCWGTPVVDPGRRAGPKGPDEERKGIGSETAGPGGTMVVVDLSST